MFDTLQTFIAPRLRSFLKLLSIGHFHKKRIVFFSYFGAQYSCNPKYISEYMQERHPDFEIIWAFKSPQNFSYLHDKGIKTVKYLHPYFLHVCLTSKFIVTNSEIPAWFPIMKRQVYINTWHGGGAYKRVGAAYQKETPGKQIRAEIAREVPCTYVSSSNAFTELTIHQSFHHDGTILSCGMPRNDMLFNNDHPELHDKIRAYYHLPSEAKILLYAPTYRESKAASDYLFDCKAIQSALSEKFGGNWFILFRTHYFVMNQLNNAANYIDASNYPDMQELLYAADVLITDYSSSMWDFSLTRRPCFLYATDLNYYDLDRGFYSDIHTWPYPLAESNSALIKNIKQCNNDQYQKNIQKHWDALGSYESGHACETVANYILTSNT